MIIIYDYSYVYTSTRLTLGKDVDGRGAADVAEGKHGAVPLGHRQPPVEEGLPDDLELLRGRLDPARDLLIFHLFFNPVGCVSSSGMK
jgi:hypothetical protein